MSRRFNTKKFIKDVLNDKYALVIGNEILLDTKIEPMWIVLRLFPLICPPLDSLGQIRKIS
jgi:hypothetical protein